MVFTENIKKAAIGSQKVDTIQEYKISSIVSNPTTRQNDNFFVIPLTSNGPTVYDPPLLCYCVFVKLGNT